MSWSNALTRALQRLTAWVRSWMEVPSELYIHTCDDPPQDVELWYDDDSCVHHPRDLVTAKRFIREVPPPLGSSPVMWWVVSCRKGYLYLVREDDNKAWGVAYDRRSRIVYR